MSGREHAKGRKRSDLSVWRIDYLALLEEKRGSRGKEKSARWRQWHEEYVQFMHEMVPKGDHDQFHRMLMDVMYERDWCREHGIDYSDPSVQLAALALCQERYGQRAPAREKADPPLAPPSGLPEEAVAGKMIMVVDDDDGVRDVLGAILKRLGHRVIACDSGDAALIEIRKCHPDMVFLDYRMPGRNGLEVLRDLMAIAPDLKVVMLTGFANLDTAKEAVDAGVIDYVSKPLDATLVREIVEDVLG